MTHRLMAVVASAFLALPVYAQEPGANIPQAPPPARTEANPTVAPEATLSQALDPCNLCPCNGERFWFSTEYQVGWIRGMRLPPLVTTSPAGTAQAAAGVLGQPGTTVLFGNSQVDRGERAGVAFDFGYWFDPERTWGIEGGYSLLESQAEGFSASASGSTILARPFTDATTGNPVALLVSFPGLSTGSVGVSAATHNLQGFYLDLREKVYGNSNFRLDALLGYRYLRFDEDLFISQSQNPSSAAFVPGTVVSAVDHFGTKNEFDGGQFALRSLFLFNRLSLEVMTRLNVGQMQREINIGGGTIVTAPNTAPSVNPGGLLALSSNSGYIENNKWVVFPEIGVTFGWQVRDRVKFTLGYNFLALPEVARAADQIDLTVNQTLLPNGGPASGANRPAFSLHTTEVWVQTLNFGLEFTY